MSAPQKDSATGFEKVGLDLVNYGQDGYQDIGFILQFVTVASSVYIALRISDILPDLSYAVWLLVALVVGVPLLSGVGYFWQKLTRLYSRGVEIAQQSHAYNYWKIPPRDIPLYTAVTLLLEKERPEAAETVDMMKLMLRRNGVVLE